MRLYKNCVVQTIYFEVTLDCILDCVFCSQKPVKNPKSTYRSIGDFKKVLEEFPEADIVMFTGGEPLLHPEILKMIKLAKKKVPEVCMETNGVLLAEMAGKLKKAGVDSVYVSIHSCDSEIEKKITGKDVLQEKLRGMEKAYEAGLRVMPSTVISSLNYKHLPEMVDRMLKKFPWIHHWVFNFIDAVGKAAKNTWTVPRYSEVDLWLFLALSKLKRRGITFRVERVPLCYMAEFAEYSTEARRIIHREVDFVHRRGRSSKSYTSRYWEWEYEKPEVCQLCWWRDICPGIEKDYVKIYGSEELYPIFLSPKQIIKKAGRD